jgi:hypothetical protein
MLFVVYDVFGWRLQGIVYPRMQAAVPTRPNCN